MDAAGQPSATLSAARRAAADRNMARARHKLLRAAGELRALPGDLDPFDRYLRAGTLGDGLVISEIDRDTDQAALGAALGLFSAALLLLADTPTGSPTVESSPGEEVYRDAAETMLAARPGYDQRFYGTPAARQRDIRRDAEAIAAQPDFRAAVESVWRDGHEAGYHLGFADGCAAGYAKGQHDG